MTTVAARSANVSDDSSFVVPGREAKRSEPGIHTHDGGYGFRACAKRRIPE